MMNKNDKRYLYWIIESYLSGTINGEAFCNAFHESYGMELDYSCLSKTEQRIFKELYDVSSRYTWIEEDLINYPGCYYNDEQLKQAVQKAKKGLSFELCLNHNSSIIQILTKESFEVINAVALFSEEFSRSFGCITINNKTYKFSWQSSIVNPQIKYFEMGIVGIGIDQHYCLLNSKNGEFKTFPLFTPFLFMKTFEKELFVVCETEIMLLNPFLLEKDREYSFDEIIKDINVKEQFLTVSFIDDSETRINLKDDNSIYLTH